MGASLTGPGSWESWHQTDARSSQTRGQVGEEAGFGVGQTVEVSTAQACAAISRAVQCFGRNTRSYQEFVNKCGSIVKLGLPVKEIRQLLLPCKIYLFLF